MFISTILICINLWANASAFDAPLVPGAVALDEPGRYRSGRTFDATIDYYQRVFKRQSGAIRWHNIVNLPGIRAKHIESLRKKTNWEGINIYEYKGMVKLFIIERQTKSQR